MSFIKENRYTIAKILAAIGTICGVLIWLIILKIINIESLSFLENVIGYGWLISTCLAYIFGGLVTAIKMAFGIAKWGWIAFPFPGDIFMFVLSLAFALLSFIFLPIIPVIKASYEYE